jgi:capsular polysaccharide transport system ATP-binding protein
VIALEGVRKSYRAGRKRNVVISDATAVFESGRSYGILGVRESGKSTLLKLIAGTELPDAGRVRRNLRVSWPLGVNGAFSRKLTPRENVRFLARIYGEDPKRVMAFVDDFAELGGDVDTPLTSFPASMRMRLAFGVSMAISFDCYLVDGIAGVGDPRFQKKCFEAFQDRRKYADVIMVSHSLAALRSYCDAGAILAGGKLRLFDTLDEAAKQFRGALTPGTQAAEADWDDVEDEDWTGAA